MADYQVVQGDNGWAVRRAGADKISSTHATQDEAEDVAKDLVRDSGGGEGSIHTPDGQARHESTIAETCPVPAGRLSARNRHIVAPPRVSTKPVHAQRRGEGRRFAT